MSKAVENLTLAELREAFDKQEMIYLMQDAECKLYDDFCLDFGDIPMKVLTENDLKRFAKLNNEETFISMARAFIDERDCETPSNDTWERIVRRFVDNVE